VTTLLLMVSQLDFGCSQLS